MKRIVILGNSASTLLNFRYELIQTLVAEGVEVFCMVNTYSDADKVKIDALGAELVAITLDSKGINPLSDIRAVWHLQKQLKAINPDVFLAYFVKPVIFGTIAACLAGIKQRVGMIEGLGNAFTPYHNGLSLKARIIKCIQILLYKVALPQLNKLIFLNPDDKKDLVDKYRIVVKDTVILGGIGVDLCDFSYTSVKIDQPASFIFVARLLREKGVFEFLRAAEKIKKKYPSVFFYILGGFDEKNPFALCKSELQSYLDSSVVQYLGHVDNVSDWLRQSSVFVLPSYREGVPRSTQEAMAIGRPVITTDVPGCRETVEDGVNGFLVPPYNVEKLVEAMECFIENPELISKMGKESRRIAEEKFNVHEVNKRLMEIIYNDNGYF